MRIVGVKDVKALTLLGVAGVLDGCERVGSEQDEPAEQCD
jgi:hypothetical protein